jgi:hypothetical protein
MMRIGRFAATDEARLLHDIAEVVSVAIASWRGDCEGALVDAASLPRLGSLRGDCFRHLLSGSY